MSKLLPHRLSRRERQIMDILYEKGQATAAEVLDALPDPPSYSTIRALLRILEEKGQAQHSQVGSRYVYTPSETWASVAKSAIEQVVATFFGGSIEKAVATLLANQQTRPNEEELNRLENLIQQAKAYEQDSDLDKEGTPQ